MQTVKFIGRGAFTRAYLMGNGKVLLRSCCPVKEAMSLGWFPEHRLFPVLERVDHGVYEMEYYPRTQGLKSYLTPKDWLWYSTLRKLYIPCGVEPNDCHSAWYAVFSSIVDAELRAVMLEALDAAANVGSDIDFEISPRNVAVKDGQLVLLDCFYSRSKLQEVRTCQKRRG